MKILHGQMCSSEYTGWTRKVSPNRVMVITEGHRRILKDAKGYQKLPEATESWPGNLMQNTVSHRSQA